MSKMAPYLEPGEQVGEPVTCNDLLGIPSATIYPISNPELKEGERVLLEIPYSLEKAVWIGSSALTVEVLAGSGIVTTINLDSAHEDTRELRQGKRVKVWPGRIYWYRSDGDEPLVLRDTCIGFDEKCEPSPEEFSKMVEEALRQGLISGV